MRQLENERIRCGKDGLAAATRHVALAIRMRSRETEKTGEAQRGRKLLRKRAKNREARRRHLRKRLGSGGSVRNELAPQKVGFPKNSPPPVDSRSFRRRDAPVRRDQFRLFVVPSGANLPFDFRDLAETAFNSRTQRLPFFARFMLPVVVAAAHREVLLRPDDLCVMAANRELTILSASGLVGLVTSVAAAT